MTAGILAAGLFFSAAAGAQDRVPAAVVNAWTNPSAEAGVSGASAESGDAAASTISQHRGDAWRGRSSFQLRFTAGQTGTAALVFGAGTGPRVNVTPGQTCYFRVAGRIAVGSPAAALELRARWLDASGHVIAETPGLSYADAPRSWTVLDGWDTAPAGAVRTALALYAVGAAGDSVVRADGVQLTVSPRRFPGYIDGDEPGCSWMGARGASASRAPEGVVNLAPNPSFEHGREKWRADAGRGAAIHSFGTNSSWAAAGRSSLRMVGSAAGPGSDISIASHPVAVVGGQEYTLRAVVNVAELPPGGKVALTLDWLDSNRASLAAESAAGERTVAAVGVKELTVTKPAPPRATDAVITIRAAGGAQGRYDLSADAFSLVADSGAAPTRPFWTGFNDQVLNGGPLTPAQDVEFDVRLGVNAVRLPINLIRSDLYKRVWPSPDAPIDLDPLAPVIDGFFRAGVRVLLLSPITPWMVMKGGGLDPAHYADIGRLSAAIVRRWPKIVAVEAHNEPNAKNFWRPAADPAQFVRFLEAVYRAVKAENPAMPVLAPSCNAPLTKNGNMSIPDYMQGFYEAGGGRWCDALSIHPYPYGASSGSGSDRTRPFWAGAVECMRQLRAVRDAFHDSKPIWITELGSPTTDPSYPPLLKTISEAQQATSTALLYDWARRQPDVQSIVYHTNASKPKAAEGDYGLFTAEGRLKPSLLALQAELHRTPPPYFDGDAPGCRWLGKPGASPSLRSR